MEQVIFRNTYVFINMYMDTITMKKRPLIWKRAMSVCWIEGRKEREEEIMQLYYDLKNKMNRLQTQYLL